MKTCHSEYGAIETLWIKPVKKGFVDQKMINEQWEELNYLSKPVYSKALHEYEQFSSNFRYLENNLKTFGSNDFVKIDSIYCRDASIATDYGMIICNMGKGGRINEPMSHREAFEASGIKILGEIKAPGTLEGGDVAWLDEKTLAVGHTYRTNINGIDQLKAFLEPHGIEIIVAEMPHYKGPSDVFHLMSVLSPVDKDLAVVYSPLMPMNFRNELISRGFNFIEVPDDEFEVMGCNVLALAPRKCLMVNGNPVTQARLIAAGCKVNTYSGDEISYKGGGGPTCLTRPMIRQI
jgi:N-dimethylarginine dimethylaminohydrolase